MLTGFNTFVHMLPCGSSCHKQPFNVAWQTFDGLRIRYANRSGGEKVVLFESAAEHFCVRPLWAGLSKQFEVRR